jgi:hypothetical protein
MDGYLAKPYSGEELNLVLAEVIRTAALTT